LGKPSDKNDKTQLLSDSQVVEVMPSPPKSPPKQVDDKNDRSVWKGLVVGADDFAPPPARPKGGRWIAVAILAVAGLGAATYVLWPKSAAVVVAADATRPAIATPADALPQDAAPGVIDAASANPAVPGGAASIDAAVPDDASQLDATVDAGVAKKLPVKRKYFRPPPGKRPIRRSH
jgi:hypothetical protein